MKNYLTPLVAGALLSAAVIFILPQPLFAHCQIPCGIYDDHARVQSMLEDAATVEKSARLIGELAGKTDAQSQNQLVRWVMNKEAHAQKIIEKISDYFLTQRVKPDQKDYTERLVRHHKVIVAAMKAKQKADVQTAKDLEKRIRDLISYYPPHSD
ncbi:superoxide dismutase, Ni [Desulfospira joergensenii]|uniref:superoxide dismutase, Ni n=1 Tax=Desulfospira joergensenii TaxID=53329 RepID=UPI0003B4A419|nr:superoxide dismutase, Ni [Desulfospira joergensenii]